MDYKNFQKLLAFFSALKDNGFKKTLKDISSFTTIGGQRVPVDKAKSMELLRMLPDFQREEFKDDNNIVKYLSDPRNRDRILGKFSREQQKELTQTLKETTAATQGVVYQQGQAPVEQPIPAGGSSGGSGIPGGIPSMGGMSSSSARPFRVVRNVPQVEKPDIAIANKSGYVAEAPPTQFHVTDKAGNIQATYSKEPLPTAPQSKLVVPGRETGDASKLVSARSDGSIIEHQPKNPTIHVADKSGNVVRTYNIKSPSALKNFSSNAQIFAQKNSVKIGNGLKNMFGNAANFGGRAGLGAINHGGNALSNLSNDRLRFSKNLGNAKSNILSKGKGKKAALAFAGAFFMIFFMGMLGGMGGTIPTGEAAPIPTGSSDIISCKFTRAGSSQLIKSSVLAGWISAAAASAGVPAQILASVAMHENQDFVANADNNHDAIKTGQYCIKGKMFCEDGKGHVFHSKQGEDDPCTPSELAAGNRNAQAVGLMQNIDIYNPGKDLCSITENLNIAATKLKNDGITAQPTQDQVTQAIHAYYNDCTYGSFSYCNEVWTDYQNCQTGSSGTVPPLVGGDYTGWAKSSFNIDVSQLPASYQQWSYEILSISAKADVAPKFKALINRSLTKVVLTPGDEGSHTSGDTVYIRPGYDVNFFKQIFIHELGHRIKGSVGTASPACNGQTIESVESEGYLTYYAEHATLANVRTPACGTQDNPDTRNDQATRSDEDFGETVSYYINNGMQELNYGSGCITYNSSLNPYTRGDRPAHKAYIQCLLGP